VSPTKSVGMLKLQVLTLVSILLIVVAVGCFAPLGRD